MNCDIKRIRRLSSRFHKLDRSLRIASEHIPDITKKLGHLVAEIRSRFGLVFGEVSDLADAKTNENLHETRAVMRFRFMLTERLFTLSEHGKDFAEFLSDQIVGLHVLKPNERRVQINCIIRILRDKLGGNLKDPIVNRELTGFVVHEALIDMRDCESRLAFLVDDPEDSVGTNHLIESRLEVLIHNERLNQTFLSLAGQYVDPVPLMFSPKYPLFCEVMDEITGDAISLLGDPYDSRNILESLLALSDACVPDRSDSCLTCLQQRTFTLFVMILTRDKVPIGLYLHYKLVRDFFHGDPSTSDMSTLFDNLFTIIQNVSADPGTDLISLLENR